MTTMNDDQLTSTGDEQVAVPAAEAVTEPANAPEPEPTVPTSPEAAVPDLASEPLANASEPPPSVEPIEAPSNAQAPVAEPTPTPEPEVQPAVEAAHETAPEPVAVPSDIAAAPVAVEEKSLSDADLFEAAWAELGSTESAPGESAFKKLSKGDRIEATVIQVEHDRVFVDLGTKSEGVVPLIELTEESIDSAHDHVKVGDRIHVVVLRPEGGAEGNPIVSKKRADFEETWNRIVDSFQEGKTLTAQVIDRVKGGLVVDIGVRGFVPATHVGSGKLRNIEKYVGQPIQLKIIEIDRERKKVVLSNRQAEEERRELVKEEIFTKVSPGDILEGTVRRLTDYGAFVDLGGIDGLLHISEMSWMRINHPKEVLKEGQKIKVMVLRLDSGNSKISLGLRQVLPDPWNLIRENYKIGQKIQCKISRLVQSGAFVKLPEGAEAFLPVSEISNRRINKPSDVLEEGQDVELAIMDLRPDERRMVLSLRNAGGAIDAPQQGYGGGSYEDDEMRARRAGGPLKKGGKKRGGRRGEDDDLDVPIVGRVPTGGATIGERLGALKGFFGRSEDLEEEEPAVEAEPEAEPEPEAAPEQTTEPTEE